MQEWCERGMIRFELARSMVSPVWVHKLVLHPRKPEIAYEISQAEVPLNQTYTAMDSGMFTHQHRSPHCHSTSCQYNCRRHTCRSRTTTASGAWAGRGELERYSWMMNACNVDSYSVWHKHTKPHCIEREAGASNNSRLEGQKQKPGVEAHGVVSPSNLDGVGSDRMRLRMWHQPCIRRGKR